MDSPPPTSPHPYAHPTTLQTLAVKDKEAAANWLLNLPVCPLAHSKPPQAPQNACKGERDSSRLCFQRIQF